jgi:hypothetical protein
MKKIMVALTVLLLMAGSGWAAETEELLSPDPAIVEAPVVSPEQPSADAETPAASTEPASSETAVAAPEKAHHGIGHKILLYLPNRILDVFDFVRLRARVGPGLSVGARVTRLLALSAGGHATVYAGLPGPRLKPTVKLPVGLETFAGVEVSVLDATNEGKYRPNYSNTEIGVSVHPLIVGLDFTVDPVEVLDLALGFLFIDIRGDDL